VLGRGRRVVAGEARGARRRAGSPLGPASTRSAGRRSRDCFSAAHASTVTMRTDHRDEEGGQRDCLALKRERRHAEGASAGEEGDAEHCAA